MLFVPNKIFLVDCNQKTFKYFLVKHYIIRECSLTLKSFPGVNVHTGDFVQRSSLRVGKVLTLASSQDESHGRVKIHSQKNWTQLQRIENHLS